MYKLCIFGAGGFAKEVFWLAKQCGKEIDAFIDLNAGENYYGTNIENDNYFDPSKHKAVVAVGSPLLRNTIVVKIINRYGKDVFDTLVAPSVNLMSNTIDIGYGSIICGNCILTCDIKLGHWSQLNLATTIGHDVKTGDFFTTAPGVHINGKVNIGDRVYFGSNSSTVEDISIYENTIIGAGACVSKDIVESGTYVGIPAKKLEKK